MKAMLFLLFLTAATTVDAAGIGAAPSELHFSLAQGEKQQRELTVYNLGTGEAAIEAKSSADFVEVTNSGTISAGSFARATVEADASKLKAGKHEATIYLTTTGTASGVSLNIGTAVKATVDVLPIAKASALTGTLISASIFAFGLLLYFAALRLPFLHPVKA